MKKIILLLTALSIISVFNFTSCEKEDPTPSLEGLFNGSFNLSGYSFSFRMNLHQDGSDLSGDFVFSDNSGYTTLSNSTISGDEVNIHANYPYDDFYMNFVGTVNAERTSINSGSLYINGDYVGSWSATKSSSKSAEEQAKFAVTQFDLFVKSVAKQFKSQE